ncbi:hypothetical protein NVP1101O_209 [Vibrio phage 1.101.O._10N.261.45.C6]|nr:hypothetical protein NVP1101O_209 [Vibrio phage 1.101.O._10N.261.45.C6]
MKTNDVIDFSVVLPACRNAQAFETKLLDSAEYLKTVKKCFTLYNKQVHKKDNDNVKSFCKPHS